MRKYWYGVAVIQLLFCSLLMAGEAHNEQENLNMVKETTHGRKVIPNVPVLSYYGNNVAFFYTLLNAMLRSIGEDCDKSKVAALSGEGNRFCWTADGSWVGGCEMAEAINEHPYDAEKRVLTAFGWTVKCVTVERGADPSKIRQDFVDSIDRGFPVLISYIRHADCNRDLFFGYEDNGKKMIAYYYNKPKEGGGFGFQSDPTPVAWDNWEENLAWYIVLQNKNEAASERDTALTTFANISAHARKTDKIRGNKVGFAAWESFLHHLEHDDFSELSVNEVGGRFGIYCDALCQINGRGEALPYYRSLIKQFPEWKYELNIAVAHLDACAWYGGFLWTEGFSFNDAGFEKFRTKEARKILADAGRVAMLNDIEAVKQFEKILRKEGKIQ